MSPRRIPARERKRTALHEAGHAVVAWHHWHCDAEPQGGRPLVPFAYVEVLTHAEEEGAEAARGRVRGVGWANPWQGLCVSLAGMLAEDGATRGRALLREIQAGDWDYMSHYYGPSTGDCRAVGEFVEATGCPDSVVRLAAAATAELLWEHRGLVRALADRVLASGGYLSGYHMGDLLPGVQESIDRVRAQAA